jgi:hypothetical protein
MAAGALALTVAPAHAQDYPGTTVAPVCTASIDFSGPAVPNAVVDVIIACADFVNGNSLVGILNSTPVALQPAATVVNKSVTYKNIKLPADWEVNARHTATLTDTSNNGRLVASIPFYVDAAGKPSASAPTATTLARTGSSNHTEDITKSAVVLLALGGAAVAISRKRRHRDTAAAA